jgi:tetratricopeptide (TPR) repeat protein
VKDEAYGRLHLHLSCRYYATHQWDQARRKLKEALLSDPGLSKNPDVFLGYLTYHAFSVRISDPLQFVVDVLEHLPDNAQVLCAHGDRLLGRVYLGLALQCYYQGRIEGAKDHLAESVRLEPKIKDDPGYIVETLVSKAMILPTRDPYRFVKTIYEHLPVEAEGLKETRLRALSAVLIAWAFRDYFMGRKQDVPLKILRGILYQTSCLKNKGVLSIFIKSLPAIFLPAYRQAEASGEPA